jgi:subtilisin family serine protease
VIARLASGVEAQEFAASYGSTVLGSVPELQLALLEVPPGREDDAFIETLRYDSQVVFAEPDYALQTAEGRQSTIAFSEGSKTWSDVVDQGALERIGVAEAHRSARGTGILVAVLDTGVDLDHPDLATRLRLPGIEPGVTAGAADDRAEGVDTNGDGIVDGALGHGTHVAGIVLAVAPEARVLPVRVLDSDGVGFAFAVARGMVLAATEGAHAANLSLGMLVVSQAVQAATAYLRGLGVVVVAPTGNGGREGIEFPASDPPVFAAAGTDDLDRKADFSNYGSGTDLAAPAWAILSSHSGGGYATWSGTSMAAPFVSGTAALAYQLLGPRSPGACDRVEWALRAGAQSLEQSDPAYAGGLGAGRVSASGSVDVVEAAAGGGTPGGGPGEEPAGGG